MRIQGIQKPCRAVRNSTEDMQDLQNDEEEEEEDDDNDELVTAVLLSNRPPNPRRRWTTPISGYRLVRLMKHSDG